MTRHEAERLVAPAVAQHVLDSEASPLLVADCGGEIVFANPAGQALLDDVPGNSGRRRLWDAMTEADARSLRAACEGEMDGPLVRPVNFVGADNEPVTLHCRAWAVDGGIALVGEPGRGDTGRLELELLELNNELIVKSRELTRRTRELEHAQKRLKDALDELETSYWHLRKLQEVLPICVECGKVKTSDSTWESVAEYLERNALFLSHGYCPDCGKAMLESHGITMEDENVG